MRKVRCDWFPRVDDDGAVWEGVGGPHDVGVLECSGQARTLWFPGIHQKGPVWEGKCCTFQGRVVEGLGVTAQWLTAGASSRVNAEMFTARRLSLKIFF